MPVIVWMSVISGVKVYLFFVLVYLYLPWQALAFYADESFLDRFFISLTAMTFLLNTGIHALALARLYDNISALALIAVCYLLLQRVSRQVRAAQSVSNGYARAIATVLDAAEHPRGFHYPLLQYLSTNLRRTLLLLSRSLRWATAPTGILMVAALTGPLYLRFHHALTRSFFGASDAYVHLAWSKYLGLGRIYQDGVYPHGYHTFLSALDKVTFLDPYWVLRFAGPLAGLLLVISVAHLTYRVTGNTTGALLAAFLYGVGAGLPTGLWRQLSALPQEYASVFFLPSLVFLADYLEKRRVRYCLLFLGAYYTAFTSHPYVAAYQVVGAACVVLVAVLNGTVTLPRAGLVVAGGVLATGAGLLPLALGRLRGLPFHSLGWAMSVAAPRPTPPTASLAQVVARSAPAVQLALAASVALLASAAVRAVASRRRTTPWRGAAYGLVALVLFVAYHARTLGLPALMEASRTATVFSLVAAASVGACAGPACAALEKRKHGRYLTLGLALLTFAAVLTRYPLVPPRGYQLEYDAAVHCYLTIRRDYSPLNWTIVAPVEQYQQVLGRGWHYELSRFVLEFTPEQVSQPRFSFPIPTTDIFIFVEKVPLGRTTPLTAEDAARPLQPMSEVNNPTAYYYRTAANRAAVQARALALIEAHSSTHAGVSIYYEDEQLRVYHIKHQPVIR